MVNLPIGAILGGPDAPIALYLLNRTSGASQSVTDRIMKPANQDIADSVTCIPDGKDLDLRVSRDPLALALMPHSYMRFSQPMQIFGECGVSLGVDPRMIKTQDYPLTAPIFLYMPLHRLPKIARKFLSYTSTDTAQAVIERAGFINQILKEVPLNQQGGRLDQAVSVAGTSSVDVAAGLAVDATKSSEPNTGTTLKIYKPCWIFWRRCGVLLCRFGFCPDPVSLTPNHGQIYNA